MLEIMFDGEFWGLILVYGIIFLGAWIWSKIVDR